MRVMFTHATGMADGHYLPSASNLITKIFEHESETNLSLQSFYSGLFEGSLVEELVSAKNINEPIKGRAAQLLLFLAIADLMAKSERLNITGFGGYCLGIIPALFASGSLSLENIYNQVFPVATKYILDLINPEKEKSLVEVTFDFSQTSMTENEVLHLISSQTENILLKDKKSSRAFELVAPRLVMKNFASKCFERLGGSLFMSHMMPSTSSHTALAPVEEYAPKFRSIPLQSNHFPMFSSIGETLSINSCSEKISAFFSNAIFNPHNTHECIKKLDVSNEELLVVGSERTMRTIFAGTNHSGIPLGAISDALDF